MEELFEKSLSIAGTFWQNRPVELFGPEMLHRDTFLGIIGPNNDSEEIQGIMYDRFGFSKLSDFEITETNFSFLKTYRGRPPIKYTFIKKDTIFVGRWGGIDAGENIASCQLTEFYANSLFNYDEILTFLEENFPK